MLKQLSNMVIDAESPHFVFVNLRNNINYCSQRISDGLLVQRNEGRHTPHAY